MFSLYHCILLLICFAAIESKQFRSDYTYHSTIDGWLKFHNIPATFQDARERCLLEGAALASPANDRMQGAMSLELNNKSLSDCGIYIGVHSIFSKGYFYSLEGIPLPKMSLSWLPGEPDNADNNESCIAYTANGIADVNCSEVLPFICFKKKTEHMTFMPCGTTDKAYEFMAKTGSCYKFHHTLKTWAEAFKICSAEGAYLAIINSREEAAVLKDLLDAHCPNCKTITFIGFYDWEKQGIWRTVHGQTLSEAGYADWERGQPDHAAPGEFCGAIFKNAKLDDYWCDRSSKFLCEKDPDSLLNYWSVNK